MCVSIAVFRFQGFNFYFYYDFSNKAASGEK